MRSRGGRACRVGKIACCARNDSAKAAGDFAHAVRGVAFQRGQGWIACRVWMPGSGGDAMHPCPPYTSGLLRAQHGSALELAAAQIVERVVGLLERIAHDLRLEPAPGRNAEKLASVGAGQV